MIIFVAYVYRDGTAGGRGDLQNNITAVAPEMVVGY